MGEWIYSDIVKEHFLHPQNVLLEPENTWACDGRGETGSLACGDQMLVLLRISNDIITDIRWKTYGCASAIASVSMMSEAVRGLSIQKAYTLKPSYIVKRLGGLPDNKIHCSVLGDEALRKAIDDFLVKQGRKPWRKRTAVAEYKKPEIVCECKNITDLDIALAYEEGICDWDSLQDFTGIGTVCGKCKELATIKIKEVEKKYKK
ncbi:MAG TPA: iron-sulfur cluster assembly scaffold protein [Treponemataceae bacterium]|nr:iron-sulfur cluster assembly scaffold protein [Treponemataceae bacterium]